MRRLLLFPILIALLSAPLAAAAASVTVTSPNGGESWALNTPHNITWTQVAAAGKTVRIVLRQGQNFIGNIATNIQATAGTIPWTVGTLENGSAPAGAGYIIRVRSDDGTLMDDSNAGFTISPPATLQLLEPNGGENWPKGQKRNIRWSAQNLPGNVKLELLQGGAVKGTISPGVAASNQALEWTVGDYPGGPAPAGEGYKVRVSAAAGTPKDESNASFKIGFFIPMTTAILTAAVKKIGPDIVVCKIIPKHVPEGYTKERLWLKVYNIGTANTVKHTVLRVWIQGAIELHEPIPEIAPNNYYEVYYEEYPYAAHGPISYNIQADFNNDVVETSETNNAIGGVIPRTSSPDQQTICSDGVVR